jgi:hypothetical protein
VVGHLEDLGALVVVGEDDRVAAALQVQDLRDDPGVGVAGLGPVAVGILERGQPPVQILGGGPGR